MPRREQEPQRERWLRTVTRRTGSWCSAASSNTRAGNSCAASFRRCRSIAGRRSPAASATAHDFAAEADQSGLPVFAGLQPHAFAAEEDFRPGGQVCGPVRPQGLPQELLLQPRHVPFGKPLGFRNRTAARNGDAGGAVRTQAQDVAPRPPVANEAQPHAPRAGDQPVFVRRGGRPGAKEPFELHAMI